MAKIKVGDKVRVKGMGGIWTVSELTSPVKVEVKSDDGFVASVALKSVTLVNSRACNSTNPVVANAMRARNAGENISGIAVNWKRNDAALKVEQAIDLLVGTHNSSRNWIDVDAEDKSALSMIGKSIADLNKAWKILLRERA